MWAASSEGSENFSSGFLPMSNTNRAVQSQMMASLEISKLGRRWILI